MYNKKRKEKEIFILAFQNHKNNKLNDAERLYKKIIKSNPNHFESNFFLGSLFAQKKKFLEAKKFLSKSIKINPNNTNAFHNLGIVFYELGEYKKGVVCSQKAIQIQPYHPEAINNLGNLYKELRELGKSKNCFEKAIEINSNNPKYYNNLGNIFKELGELEKATTFYKKTIQIKPNHSNAYYNLGLVYKILGNFQDAEIAYKNSLKYEPKNLITAYELVKLNEKFLNIDLKEEIEKILKENYLNKKNMAYGNFLLSKYELKNKNYKNEFKFLMNGHSYYFDSEMKKFKNGVNYWLNKLPNMKELNKFKNTETLYKKLKPIFIIGVPRCGSTLIEKVIASGRNYIPTGEETGIFSKFVGEKINKKESFSKDKKKFQLEIYENYKEKGLVQEKNSFFFTDKSLDNFFYITLIKEIFPSAKIINCKRKPLSSIISIIKNNLRDVTWAHNLDHIFKFFDIYFKKTQYFKKKFPNFIYELEYEKFVENPEEESKKLFKFCNLKWDKKCLEFYKRKDLISQTASNIQIRKSIFKTGIKKYQPYEKLLVKYKSKYKWFI